MALKRGIVELQDHNPKWKELYAKEAKTLKEVLGDRIIEIEHVGSTSIEGLKAKPIIDMLVVINSLDEIPEIEELLKDYDYSNRGSQGVSDRCFFAKGPEESRSHYVHFTEPKSETYYHLKYFKKYLLEHEEYKQKYCNLKQELAIKYADERSKYTASKNDFIKSVIKLAREEYDD